MGLNPVLLNVLEYGTEIGSPTTNRIEGNWFALAIDVDPLNLRVEVEDVYPFWIVLADN